MYRCVIARLGCASFWLLAAGLSAHSEEVCIYCMQPSATYACALEATDSLAGAKYAGTALQYFCLTELAKVGHHASCRVEREPLGGVCNGERRVISLLGARADEIKAAELAQPASPGAPASLTGAVAPAEPGHKSPPATMEELVKQQAKSSKDDIKAASKSFNASVKKSWDCLTSLFQSCN